MKGVVCGKGGQGVVTLNRMLGSCLSELGENVIAAETHGMAMRGGSVSTFIKIGGFCSGSFGSREADFIISTDKNELPLNINYLKDSGVAIVDLSGISDYKDSKIININATNLSLNFFTNTKYTNWFLFFKFFKVFDQRFDFKKVTEIVTINRLIEQEKLQIILDNLE